MHLRKRFMYKEDAACFLVSLRYIFDDIIPLLNSQSSYTCGYIDGIFCWPVNIMIDYRYASLFDAFNMEIV